MFLFLIFLLLAFISYAIIPTLFFRLFAAKSFKHDHNQSVVHLTFDDGPDPLYTPMLLDLLKEYGAKGTFFVVGERAKKYPELILRLKEEGHTIGIHNDKHTSNWFTDPFSFQAQLKKCSDTVEAITGEKPVYYRPPWGHFNLFSWTAATNFKMIFWKYTPRDWKVTEKKELTQKLLNNLHNGSIILLHDCGKTFGADEDAPMVMIEALRETFEKVRNSSMIFNALEEKITKEVNMEKTIEKIR